MTGLDPALLQQLPLFMAATLLLNATPGVDLLLTVTRTAQGGARAGAMAALGIAAGCAVHALVAVGLGYLLASALALWFWVSRRPPPPSARSPRASASKPATSWPRCSRWRPVR